MHTSNNEEIYLCGNELFALRAVDIHETLLLIALDHTVTHSFKDPDVGHT